MKIKIKRSLQIRNKEKYLPLVLTFIIAFIPVIIAYLSLNNDAPFNLGDVIISGGISFVVLFIGLICSIDNIKKINAQLNNKEIMCVYLKDDSISFVGRIGKNRAVKAYSYSEIENINMSVNTHMAVTKGGNYQKIDSIDILFKLKNGTELKFSPFGEMSSIQRFIDISNKVSNFDYQILGEAFYGKSTPIGEQIEFYKNNGKTKTEIWYAMDVLKIFAIFIIVWLVIGFIVHYFSGF